MRSPNSAWKWNACLACLVFFGGCQAFTTAPLDKEGVRGLSDKAPPSHKYRPHSIESLTGFSNDEALVPGEQYSRQPVDTPTDRGLGKSGLSIDDVLLAPERVHIETASMDDIDDDQRTQLPGFIESAVHPYGDLDGLWQISDQVPDTASPDQMDLPVADSSTQQQDSTGSTNPPDPTSSSPVNSGSGMQTADQGSRKNQTTTGSGDESSMMRIVAEPKADPAKNVPSSVDSLFDNPPTDPPAADDRQVIQQVSFEQEIPGLIDSPSDFSRSSNTGPTSAELLNTPVGSGLKQQTWDEQLDSAIHHLDRQIRQNADDTDVEQQVKLHLLKMIAGEPVEAINLSGGNAQYQEYWRHQLQALDHLLNSGTEAPVTEASAAALKRRRATLAARQLDLASSRLASISTLRLVNCAFTDEVRGFGQFQPAQTPFYGGQQVLIYCEIENYSLRQMKHEANTTGFQAELLGRYSIVDDQNRVIYQHQYQPVQDRAHRRRKDFYMFFPIDIPELTPGQYRLQLSVEDLVGKKMASLPEDLVFQVAAGSTPETAKPRRAKTADGPRTPPVFRR